MNALPVRLGWRKDRPDDRDFRAGAILTAAPPPPRSDNTALTQVLDQKRLGACTCFAFTQALRIAQIRAGAVDPEFASQLALYWWARKMTNEELLDDGTYLRNVAYVAQKFGFPPESAWPYSDDSSPGAPAFQEPGLAAQRAAYDQHAPTEYYRIDDATRLDDVRRALAAGYGVVFGTLVSEAFCRDEMKGQVIGPPGLSDQLAGGHAMCLVGHDDSIRAAKVVNSWSPRWGEAGYWRMSYDYLEDARTNDLWAIRLAPKFR